MARSPMSRSLALIFASFGLASPIVVSADESGSRPKTLLKWSAGKSDDESEEPKNNGNGDKPENGSGEKPDKGSAAKLIDPFRAGEGGVRRTALADADTLGSDGGHIGRVGLDRNKEEDDHIVTDRPDFTEASSTVGRGRVQLEAGYTFSSKAQAGGYVFNHTYPEMLFRIGLFAEWFELRIGQFWTSTIDTTRGGRTAMTGAEDLYLGVKLGLTEQKRFFPEAALVLQMLVPSGSPAFTNGQVLPGFNLLYGWDVIADLYSIGGSFQMNRRLDDVGRFYTESACSVTNGISLSKKLGMYAEWFALFPSGSSTPGIGASHYIDGGFTYKLRPNFQLDIRAGKGLSANSDDYFVGAGFAIRR